MPLHMHASSHMPPWCQVSLQCRAHCATLPSAASLARCDSTSHSASPFVSVSMPSLPTQGNARVKSVSFQTGEAETKVPRAKMPYRVYEVMASTTHEVQTADDEHGGSSTHYVDQIVVKIPKEEMCFGWSQRYAILSLLFVPALIDALWIYFSGPLRSMGPPPRPLIDDRPKPPTKEDKRPYWKKKKDDFKKEFCADGPIFFLISLPCLAFALAIALVVGPVFALMIANFDIS